MLVTIVAVIEVYKMKRAADHAMLLARRANAERNYARSNNIRDLTDVLESSAAITQNLSAPEEKVERKGAPIGQRWA